MINRDGRFQRLAMLFAPPAGVVPEWTALNRIAAALGKPLFGPEVSDERALFRAMCSQVPAFRGLTLARIGTAGVMLSEITGG